MQTVLIMIAVWLLGIIALLAWIWWINRPIKTMRGWERFRQDD